MIEYGMNVETNLNENFNIYGKKEKEKEMVIYISMNFFSFRKSREKHRYGFEGPNLSRGKIAETSLLKSHTQADKNFQKRVYSQKTRVNA